MTDDVVWGRNPVREAMRGRRRVTRILVAAGARGAAIDEIVRRAKAAGIELQRVPRSVLTAAVGSERHQGVAAWVEPFPYAELEQVVDVARAQGEPLRLLICAGIEDPRNLGALIRTAEAAGFHGAVIPKHRSAGPGPGVERASAGAVEHLPLVRVTNLSRTLEEIKERGVWVYAVDARGDRDYFEVDFTGPVALVVGGEGKGIPRNVFVHCDQAVRIPMQGRVSSLNASVAGGLVMYEIVRQRLSALRKRSDAARLDRD